MSIIKRVILYPGKSSLGTLEPESKLIYHFETVIINKQGSEQIVIDDSRRLANGQPVETIYGKQFKLPIWESCLTSMRIGEICQLTVRDDPVTHYICLNYVVTSKCFRKHYKMKPTIKHTHNHNLNDHDDPFAHASSHHCSMSIQNSPYADLNKMINNPPEIFLFTFELVDVIPPESYTKDIWQMSDQEKLTMLPKFREEGNKNFNECEYERATIAYSKGLSILESLMLKEKPGDMDYIKLEQQMIPFLLNLAQVKLNQHEYYDCIKHTNEVLKRDPENIKALFRRAKAHVNVWNLNDAKKDYRKCSELDRGMTKIVTKCLQELKTKELITTQKDGEIYKAMFAKNGTPSKVNQ